MTDKHDSHLFRKRLLRFFPTPKFLTMPAVGLDVSDQTIKFVELLRTTSGYKLGRFGSHTLPNGVVVEGEVRNMKALTEALATLQKEHKLGFIRASLPEQKAYFFQTQVPHNASEEDIRKVLEFKLEEHVPIPARDAIVDYDLLGSVHDKSYLEVGVTVYPRKTVEEYSAVFTRAGLIPLSFEMEAQAVQRAVLAKEELGTYMIVDFGDTRTGLSIVNGGMLSFTSTLDVSGVELTRAIMDTLSVSLIDVVRIKNERGIADSKKDEKLVNAMMPTINKLKDEIDRHHTYWKSRKDIHTTYGVVDKVILCGGNANMRGLPEFLSSNLSIPTQRANAWKNAFEFKESVPELDYAQSLSYSTAIGLALRDST